MTDLTNLFWARSIAIVGATSDAGLIRGRILEHLLQRNYQGKLYLVSSSQAEIRGHRTFASLREISEPVDVVLIAIRAEATEAILRDCIDIQAKFAICFSSGFAEEGHEGAVMQERIATLVRGSSLRVVGPNSAGFYNVKGQIPATFARNVDIRRQAAASHRKAGGKVGLVTQSGGLAFAIQDRCTAEHGLFFSYIVTTGNEVDLEALDCLDYALMDDETNVVLLLIEGIKSTAKIAAIAGRARATGKPIVVSKFGRTAAGSRAATSHAARLTGSDAAYDAAFRRHGLIRIDDEDEMCDLAAAFACSKQPKGGRVAILTTSGGAGVWMADACESAGLDVPKLDQATQGALAQYIPSFGSALNPVDMTAHVSVNPTVAGAAASALIGTIETIAASPSVDMMVLCANMSDGAFLAREREGLIALTQRLEKPLFLYSHATPSRSSLDLVQEMGLVCFASTRRLARTLRHLVDYAGFAASDAPAAAHEAAPAWSPTELAGGICEYQAKSVLRENGIAIPPDRLARTADEAAAAAAAFGFPVALKIQSPQIPHKTEVGGVMLNLADEKAVRAGFNDMVKRARASEPDAEIHGVLVQPMLDPGRELALGIVRDADFGPMMMVGLGGIHIEVLKDVTLEPLPVTRAIADQMLRRLRGFPLLAGARGAAPADIDAVADLMEKLSAFVLSRGHAVQEIDLNPVFVYESGKGVAVVDAIVVGENRPANAH